MPGCVRVPCAGPHRVHGVRRLPADPVGVLRADAVQRPFGPKFVGFDNFRRMFTTDPSFWPSVRATLLLVVLYVPLSLAIGSALAASFCNQRMRVSLLRTLRDLPVVLPVVATITLWKFVFNPQVGLANQVLTWLHLPTSEWLSGSDSAMPSIVIVMLWSVGSTMIIFLAALQAVPTELYEAARLDGAGPQDGVLPDHPAADQPIMVLQVVLQMVTALQAFNQPKILSPDGMGGPGFSTRVLMLSIYTNGFPSLGRVAQLGYASAQVWGALPRHRRPDRRHRSLLHLDLQ